MKIDETLVDDRPWHAQYLQNRSSNDRNTVSRSFWHPTFGFYALFMKAPPIGAQPRKNQTKKKTKGHSPKKYIRDGFVVVFQEVSRSLSLGDRFWSPPATDPARSSSTANHSGKHQARCGSEVVRRRCRKKGKETQPPTLCTTSPECTHTSHFIP